MKQLEWIMTFGLGLIFAGCFAGVGADRLDRQKDYVSLLFFFVAHWSFHPAFKVREGRDGRKAVAPLLVVPSAPPSPPFLLWQAVGSYPKQRDVLTRERASDSYSVVSWYVAGLLHANRPSVRPSSSSSRPRPP